MIKFWSLCSYYIRSVETCVEARRVSFRWKVEPNGSRPGVSETTKIQVES